MTIEELHRQFVFPSAGPKVAPGDFYLLLEHTTGKDRAFLLAHPEHTITGTTLRRAKRSLSARVRHKPVAYILGEKEFFGHTFDVTAATLIPRPETEILAEKTLERASRIRSADIVDVGTGSGAIIISLALALPTRFRFFGLDISPQALSVARGNARKFRISRKVRFQKSDLLDAYLAGAQPDRHTIIVANLPYVSAAAYRHAAPDLAYEPRTALVSSERGLGHIRRLLGQVKRLAKNQKNIDVFLEISPEQASRLGQLIRRTFPGTRPKTTRDLSGRARIIAFSL